MACDNKDGFTRCLGTGPRDTNWRSYSKSLIVELKEKLADRRARTLALLSEEEDLAAFNELDTESDGLEDTSTNMTNNPCQDLHSSLPPEQSLSETSSLTESDYRELGSCHSESKQRSLTPHRRVASRHSSESCSTVTSASCDSISSEGSSNRSSGNEEIDAEERNDMKGPPIDIDVEQNVSDTTILEPSLVGYTDFSEETVVDRDYMVDISKQTITNDHGREYIRTETSQITRSASIRSKSHTPPCSTTGDPMASKSETSLLETSDVSAPAPDLHSLHTGILMASLQRISQCHHEHNSRQQWTLSISFQCCHKVAQSIESLSPTSCEQESSQPAYSDAGLPDVGEILYDGKMSVNTQADRDVGNESERNQGSEVESVQKEVGHSGLCVTNDRKQEHGETGLNGGDGALKDVRNDVYNIEEPEKHKTDKDYGHQTEYHYFTEDENDEECDEEESDGDQELYYDEEDSEGLKVTVEGGSEEYKEDLEAEEQSGRREEERYKVQNIQILQTENVSSENPIAHTKIEGSHSLYSTVKDKQDISAVRAPLFSYNEESFKALKYMLEEVLSIFDDNMALYDDIDKKVLAILESVFAKCGGVLPLQENVSGNSGYTNLKRLPGDEKSQEFQRSPCELSGRMQMCLDKARLASSLQLEISGMRTYPQTVAAQAAYKKSLNDLEVSMLGFLEEVKAKSSADNSDRKQNGDFLTESASRSSGLVRSNTFLVTDRNSRKPPKCIKSEKRGPFPLKVVPKNTMFGFKKTDIIDIDDTKYPDGECDSGRDPHISPTYIVADSGSFDADQKRFQQVSAQGIKFKVQSVVFGACNMDRPRSTGLFAGANDFDSDSSGSLPDNKRETSPHKYTSSMLEKLLDYDSLDDDKNGQEETESTICKSNIPHEEISGMRSRTKKKTWGQTFLCLNRAQNEPLLQFQNIDVNKSSEKDRLKLPLDVMSPEEKMDYNYESDFNAESDSDKNDNDDEEGNRDEINFKSDDSFNGSPINLSPTRQDREIIIREKSPPEEQDTSATNIIDAVFSAQPVAQCASLLGQTTANGRTSPQEFPSPTQTASDFTHYPEYGANTLTSPLTKPLGEDSVGRTNALTSPGKVASSSRQSILKDSDPSTKHDKPKKGSHSKWDITNKGKQSRPGSFFPKIEWSSSEEDLVDDLHRDISPSDYLKQKQKEDVDGKLHQLKQFAKRKKKSKSPLRLRTPNGTDAIDQFDTGHSSGSKNYEFKSPDESQDQSVENVENVLQYAQSSSRADSLVSLNNTLPDQSGVSEVFLSASELLQARINIDREESCSDAADAGTSAQAGNYNTNLTSTLPLTKVVTNLFNQEIQTHPAEKEANVGIQDSPARTTSSASSTSGEYTLQNFSDKIYSKSDSDLKPSANRTVFCSDVYTRCVDDKTNGGNLNHISKKNGSNDDDKQICAYNNSRIQSNLHQTKSTDGDVANSIEHQVRHVKEEITSITKSFYPDSFAVVRDGQTSTVNSLLQHVFDSSAIDSGLGIDHSVLRTKPPSSREVTLSIPTPTLPRKGKNVNTPYTADMFQIDDRQTISSVGPVLVEDHHLEQANVSKEAPIRFLSGQQESRNVLNLRTPVHSKVDPSSQSPSAGVQLMDETTSFPGREIEPAAQYVILDSAKLQRQPVYEHVNSDVFPHTNRCDSSSQCCVGMNTLYNYGHNRADQKTPADHCNAMPPRPRSSQDQMAEANNHMLLALSYKVTQLERALGLLQNKTACNETQSRLKYCNGEEIVSSTDGHANSQQIHLGLMASSLPSTSLQVGPCAWHPCFCSWNQTHDSKSDAHCPQNFGFCKCFVDTPTRSETADQSAGKQCNLLRHSQSTQTDSSHTPQNNQAMAPNTCSEETSQASHTGSDLEGLRQMLSDVQHSIQSFKQCSETSNESLHSLDQRLTSLEAEMSLKLDSQKTHLREIQVALTEDLRRNSSSRDAQSDVSCTIAQLTEAVDRATAVNQQAVQEQMSEVSCHLMKAVQDIVFPIHEAVSTLRGEVNDVAVSTERVRLAMEDSRTIPPSKGMDHETMKMRIVELTSQRDAEKVFHKITRESLRALERDHDRLRQEFVRATCRQERQGEKNVHSRVMYYLADKDRDDYGNNTRHKSKRGDKNPSSPRFNSKGPSTEFESQNTNKCKSRYHSRKSGKRLKPTWETDSGEPSVVRRHKRNTAGEGLLSEADSGNSKQSVYSDGKESRTSSKYSEQSHKSATSGSETPHDACRDVKHSNILMCPPHKHSRATTGHDRHSSVKSKLLHTDFVTDYTTYVKARLLKGDPTHPYNLSLQTAQEMASSPRPKTEEDQTETSQFGVEKLSDVNSKDTQVGVRGEQNETPARSDKVSTDTNSQDSILAQRSGDSGAPATQDEVDLKQEASNSPSGSSVGLSDTDF